MARILIVEDEFIIAHDIKMILEKLGHEVAGSAENAEDALKLLKEANPELILLDINLEGEIDGGEVEVQPYARAWVPQCSDRPRCTFPWRQRDYIGHPGNRDSN
ncbi:MAG: response regulator, partial [Bacteroidetes bacterium]|nr:response regulator [Bacteroidota bacterium]